MFDKLVLSCDFENLSTSSRYFSSSNNLGLDALVISRMPQERLHNQTLYANVNRKRPVEQLGTQWFDYIEDLGWNRLRLRPTKFQPV